jgi:hypothetical protein
MYQESIAMPSPRYANREFVEKLFENSVIHYEPGGDYVVWFGRAVRLNEGERHCMEPLLKNLRRGNLPISQERVLCSWPGKSNTVSDLCKRSALWKTAIVGDGRGNYWLFIPDEYYDKYAG